MLDICLLGTGGMMPMPDRFLTSLLTRLNGRMVLIDCGEGTQVTMKMLGWGFKNIDAICFTHFHADHISGLPGLLLTIGNAGREEPLTLIGPPGMGFIIEGLRRIAPELPFALNLIELNAEVESPIQLGEFEIAFCPADHMVRCFAYRINVRRKGKFDAQKASALGLPKPLWGQLQKQGGVEWQGKVYTPDMVLGAERAGISVAYCTDSRPVDRLAAFAQGVQLFICEGMYGEEDKKPKALEHKHMLFSEAAHLAKNAGAEKLWLTHFSPALHDPEEWLFAAADIFPDVELGEERKCTTLYFPKED